MSELINEEYSAFDQPVGTGVYSSTDPGEGANCGQVKGGKTESQMSESSQEYKPRIRRTKFSDQQLMKLNLAFEEENYPREETFEMLAESTGLNVRTVTVWFQNTRQKCKRSEKRRNDQEASTMSAPKELATATDTFPSNMAHEVFENSCVPQHFITNCLMAMTNQLNGQNNRDPRQNWTSSSDKRFRTSISAEQVARLSEIFKQNNCPSSALLDEIVAELFLPKKVIQVWFQNARAREKKISKNPGHKERMTSDGNTKQERVDSSSNSHELASNQSFSEEGPEVDEEVPICNVKAVSDIINENTDPSSEQIEMIDGKLNLKAEFINRAIKQNGGRPTQKREDLGDSCPLCSRPFSGTYADHVCEDEHISNLVKIGTSDLIGVKPTENGVVEATKKNNNYETFRNSCGLMPLPYLTPLMFNLMINSFTMPQDSASNIISMLNGIKGLLPDEVMHQIMMRYSQNSANPIFYSQNNESISDLLSKFDKYQLNYASSSILSRFFHCRQCGNLNGPLTLNNSVEDAKCSKCVDSVDPNFIRGLMIYKIGWSCLVCDAKFECQNELHHHILTNHIKYIF